VLVVVQSVPWLVAIDLAHAIAARRRWRAARWRPYATLAVVAGFGLYMPIRVVAERDDVRVRRHELRVGTAAPFRIAFIADVQQDVHTDADRAREIYQIVNAERPDVILSGGDWINAGPDHIRSAAATAALLKSRLGTFSVRGDHEHFAYFDRERSVREVESAMREHGIAMLDNETRWFEHGGKRIAVAFLSYNYIHRTDPAKIEALLASVASADYSILVTHQLDRKLAALVEDRVDLVLAGHTHGGQFNPVIGVVHVRLARLETEHVDGRYALGKRTTVIVTAGIGYSVVPLRYASPGSFEFIELRL
jgi:predicted MPP superfamily phosphohydrolase